MGDDAIVKVNFTNRARPEYLQKLKDIAHERSKGGPRVSACAILDEALTLYFEKVEKDAKS